MKAFVIDGYGGPEVLVERDVAKPIAGPSQVVVRIYAASYNPIDVKLASGDMKEFAPLKFPWTPGADFSGVVEQIGEGVTGLAVDDEVYGFSSIGGCYAEKLLIDASAIGHKLLSLSHVEAASLALVGQTAAQALDAADLKAGQTILIHGASGSVGSAAVQIAHSLGAKVIATGSAESLPYLQSIGADQVIDYKTTPFESVAKEVDAVLDTIGGDTQHRSFAVLKPNGILVALTEPPSQELAEKYHVRIVMLDTKSTRTNLDELSMLIEASKLKPNVGKVMEFSEIAATWRALPTLKVFGKIVFVVGG
jgi:NADPH:quinone reductase-like Zn-dependent oxidoreductase